MYLPSLWQQYLAEFLEEWAAPAAVSSTVFKRRSHEKGWIPFFSKKLLDYYQLLVFAGEINCLTSLQELIPCRKLGCFCF